MRSQTSLVILAILLLNVMAEEPFLGEDYKAGLIKLDNRDDMFYWLLRSRRDTANDPLVFWLTGGPGCASEVALLFENGGFTVEHDQSYTLNPHSWSEISNIVFVDNPVGTGFSEAPYSHLDKTEEEIAANLYLFLQGFIRENPEYAGRDFYITGESYAGHYIPAFAYYLVHDATDPPVNFKGVAIGNGWVDPYNQYPAYAEFAYENGLVDEAMYHILQRGFSVCQEMIANDVMTIITMDTCSIFEEIVLGNPLKPKFNVYDIRIPCEDPPLCYDFSAADVMLNDPEVQDLLGVSGRKWKDCVTDVHLKLLGDWMVSLQPKMTFILEAGVDVLVYSGDKDYACNWRGGEAWTQKTEWHGQEEFINTPYMAWNVDGVAAGEIRQVENFKFLRIYDAGHMVPMDLPHIALEMLRTFITKEIENVDLAPIPEITQ